MLDRLDILVDPDESTICPLCHQSPVDIDDSGDEKTFCAFCEEPY